MQKKGCRKELSYWTNLNYLVTLFRNLGSVVETLMSCYPLMIDWVLLLLEWKFKNLDTILVLFSQHPRLQKVIITLSAINNSWMTRSTPRLIGH